jgi:MSHA biogenesis protein MshO
MTTRASRQAFGQRGFTLVEAIVVMVIVGILSGIMVLFIRQPVRNYTDAAARADISESADLTLRRMARELRSALPNSVRLMPDGAAILLEFIPTKAGGQYLAVEDNVGGTPLGFTPGSGNNFSVVGPMPAAPYAIVKNDYIVVYNLGPGFAGADAYVGTNMAQVSDDPVGSLVKLNSNPFIVAAGAVPNSSPGHRFQVVQQPVTFRCQGTANGKGTLTRFSGYGFNATQAAPSTNGALMANNVIGCDFNVTSAANQQSALIGLTIALARPDLAKANGQLETVTLSHQVHVDNTP